MMGTAKCTFALPMLTTSNGPPPKLLKAGVLKATCATAAEIPSKMMAAVQ
jgi:hypothetical protein